MTEISAIIPCYNYAHFLTECVESIVSQQGVTVRVLIIDDASTDDTQAVGQALAVHDQRIEYRRHTVNRGHIATYNEGLAWATGKYTLLLSADDLLVPGALHRAAAVMDAHPEVGFVYGQAITFTTGQMLPKPRIPTGESQVQIWDGLDWIEAACRSAHIYIRSPEVLVRTQLQQELGGYRPELPRTGDIEMWMRFAAQGALGQIVDADQAYYRIHTQNMHIHQLSSDLADLQQRRAAFDTLFREYGDFIPQTRRLQALVNRRLAREACGAAAGALDAGEGVTAMTRDLIAFACSTYRFAPLTREYAGLTARKLFGPGFSAVMCFARGLALPSWARR
jgi:glycosyltransferase involved in cell wall biosynthesis